MFKQNFENFESLADHQGLKATPEEKNQDRRNFNKQRSERHIEKKNYESTQKGKGIQCKECEGFGHIQLNCANTRKKNKSLNTTLSDDERNEETDYDEGNDVDHNDTVAFNVVAGMKDTSMHEVENNVDNEESIYNNEEDVAVIFQELRDKYSPMYTKWVELSQINKSLKKDLQDVQTQNESLEYRNYELMALIKDVTDRLNHDKSRITRMNI